MKLLPLTFQWPSCKHPKTLSFRAKDNDVIFKTVNSVYLDPTEGGFEANTTDSCFTNTSESVASFSTDSDGFGFYDCGESLEAVVRGVLSSSERLFFEPGGDTSSILEEAKTVGFPFKESVMLALESDDPYVDFRKSMEEMVESHGLKDWDCLEELLSWYLRVNGKINHGVIVEAFVDLLINLTSSSSSSNNNNNNNNDNNTCCTNESTCYSSAASSFADSPLCSFNGDHENEIQEVEEEEENLVIGS